MKNFPFKILFLCIFLPPVCYILTLNGLEKYLGKGETETVQELMIQDQQALYEGRHTIKEEINRNIGRYLTHDFKHKIGIKTEILVKTRDDRILYPSQTKLDTTSPFQEEGGFAETGLESLRYTEVASENYRILNEGLILDVNLKIGQNTWLSNGILIVYIFLSLAVLQAFIRRGIRQTEKEEGEQKRLVQKLSDQLNQAEAKLKEVEEREREYVERITALRKDKDELARDVDGLLEELESQEAGLKDQKRIKEEMAGQVDQLKEELDRLAQQSRKIKKTVEATKKRFGVLYRNLLFMDRALEGFLSLTDEFQLKAEETIHKLNEDESAITVKRKVFGKGGKMDFLEITFAYSGRLYYQKDSQARKMIVAIGTKNTQEKDLAYLGSIK
jgi:methyl-accepting chemotaxis protein